MTALYLIRHAIAEERGPKFPDDDTRPLTRAGRTRMKLAVAGFRTLEPKLDVILSSPLVRAEATAKIVRAGLGRETPIEICPELAPGHEPEDIAGTLGRHTSASAIALVGHEPDLGQLAAWLVGAGEPIPFKKGSICRVDVASLPPKLRGRLIWFALPKMLRALD